MKNSKENTGSTNSLASSEKDAAVDESSATMTPEEHVEVGEILDKLDPEEKEIISTMISYSGPLPPPELLKGYAETLPDAPNRIFEMAEDQQRHRQEIESRLLDKSFNYKNFGMVCGAIITITFVICSFLLIFFDKEWYGLALLGSCVATVVGFMIIQRYDKEENKDNNSSEEE